MRFLPYIRAVAEISIITFRDQVGERPVSTLESRRWFSRCKTEIEVAAREPHPVHGCFVARAATYMVVEKHGAGRGFFLWRRKAYPGAPNIGRLSHKYISIR